MQGHYLFGIAEGLKPFLKQMKKVPVDRAVKAVQKRTVKKKKKNSEDRKGLVRTGKG